MYTNDIVTKFYVFECNKNSCFKILNSEKELISFLAKACYFSLRDNSLHNRYFDNLNMNTKDLYFDENDSYKIRSFVFIDSNNRVIDIRDYKERIFEEFILCKNKKSIHKSEKNPQYDELLYTWRGSYHYRTTPVPRTSSKHRYLYGIRFPRTSNEIKQNNNPFNKPFVRGKRRNLPTCWDDLCRIPQKSWKEQSKKRKQWM